MGANELGRLVKELGWEQMNWGGWLRASESEREAVQLIKGVYITRR